MIFFLSVRGYRKTVKCQGKIGKSQGILKWMISGNPDKEVVCQGFVKSSSTPKIKYANVFAEKLRKAFQFFCPKWEICFSYILAKLHCYNLAKYLRMFDSSKWE